MDLVRESRCTLLGSTACVSCAAALSLRHAVLGACGRPASVLLPVSPLPHRPQPAWLHCSSCITAVSKVFRMHSPQADTGLCMQSNGVRGAVNAPLLSAVERRVSLLHAWGPAPALPLDLTHLRKQRQLPCALLHLQQVDLQQSELLRLAGLYLIIVTQVCISIWNAHCQLAWHGLIKALSGRCMMERTMHLISA